jgi:hypothetical protein
MKMIAFFTLIMMSVAVTSCGGKDGGGGNGKSISQLQAGQAYTKKGFYVPQTMALEIDGVSYPANQAYATVMNQAILAAQNAQPQVQPVLVDGVYKFRAQISGISTGAGLQNGYSTVGYQQNPYQQQQYGQAQLQLTSVSFYR